jgi:photosystem II stability/assembly factor-like uncharacterized protein
MLAEINGTAVDDDVRSHLAACAGCRADLNSWAAVAAGMRHLAAGIQVPTGASLEPVPVPHAPHRRFQFGPRALVAAAAAAAAVAALLIVLLPGHSRLTRPFHTAWAAARALPQEAVTGRASSAGGWRLASYLISVGWQQDTAGPEPGFLTCPSARTCYVQGDNATSASGPADMNSFYVSYDHGLSWSVLPLPAGLTFTSALSCGSETDCAAGGRYGGQPVFGQTADGGHSWKVEPLPAAVAGLIFQLSCPTVTTCNGLLTTSAAQPPAGQQYYGGVTFLRTTDAGQHFVTSAFPAHAAMQALSCPTVRDCMATGVSVADLSANAIGSRALVAATTDGGATWTQGSVPSRVNAAPFPQIACPDAARCFMLGTSNPRTGYGDVAMSADGGRTWTERPLPADIPQPDLSQISCPTASTCYASGGEAIAQRFANGSSNGSSAMILVTNDAGLHWSRITFQVPVQVPAGMQYDAFMDVGGIQCPQVNTCVALGVSDQGSKSTPVYTDSTVP